MSAVTLFNLRSDIQLILGKSTKSQDSRLNDPRHIEFLIKKYRSRGIREEYGRTLEISPSWLQDLGSKNMTLVNSAEDPEITCGTVQLGKIVIPQVIDLPQDHGLFKVSSMSNTGKYYPISMNRFFSIPKGSDRDKFNYYFRIGNHLYTKDPLEKGRIIIIADDFMDCDYFDNTKQTVLIIGTSYTVKKAVIVHAGNTINPDAAFTATTEAFTGSGDVYLTNPRRTMTDRDPMPMSLTLSEYVTMKILTQEFLIEPKQIADIKNDSVDELSLLQPQS